MTKAASDLDRLRIRLNDRQPVKVLKSLNDRQSDIFLKLRNRRSASNCNYNMSIKNCQAIQKSCLDSDSNAWFTLGSAQPSVTNHACFRYGWRNGKKFTKFIFIHIQCSYWYSRIYLFTFNNRNHDLFTFTCVFSIHDYICSHLRDVSIHIQRVISIHIHDRNIHLTFSAHHLCASVSIKYGLRITDYGLRTGYKTRTQV